MRGAHVAMKKLRRSWALKNAFLLINFLNMHLKKIISSL